MYLFIQPVKSVVRKNCVLKSQIPSSLLIKTKTHEWLLPIQCVKNIRCCCLNFLASVDSALSSYRTSSGLKDKETLISFEEIPRQDKTQLDVSNENDLAIRRLSRPSHSYCSSSTSYKASQM